MSLDEKRTEQVDEASTDTPATEPALSAEHDSVDERRAAIAATGQADIEAFASRPTGENKPAARRRRPWIKWSSLVAGIAVLAVVTVLLTQVWLPEEDTDPDTEYPDTTVTLLDKQLDESGKEIDYPIRSIHLRSLLEEMTLTLSDDNTWSLDKAPKDALNSSVINDLVEKLTYVQAEDTVAEGGVNMADYGLESPTVTADVVYADGTEVKWELASLAIGEHYYLRMNGGESVYLVGSSLPGALMQKAEAFLNLSIITEPSVNSEDSNGAAVLKELSLTGPVRNNQQTTLRRKNPDEDEEFAHSSYLLTQPYKSDTDTDTATSIASVTAISANEAVALNPTDEQLKEYGLDNPQSIAKLVLAVYTYTADDDGNATAIGYYNEMTHLIKVGNHTEDDEYYVLVDTCDTVYLVSAEYLPWATLTYHDITSQYLFIRDLASLSSIACTLDGKTYDFTFEHFPDAESLDDTLRVTMDGTVYPTEEFRTLFQVLMTLFRTGAAPAEPQGEPLLTVRITPSNADFAVQEISIYAYSGSVCIAQTNAGDTYKMTASLVEDALQQIRNYINGNEVWNKF